MAKQRLSPSKTIEIATTLKRADFLKLATPYIEQKIDLLWFNYTQTALILSPKENPVFYRAIRYDERPTHISRLTYHENPSLGRANFAGKPVFYLENNLQDNAQNH